MIMLIIYIVLAFFAICIGVGILVAVLQGLALLILGLFELLCLPFMAVRAIVEEVDRPQPYTKWPKLSKARQEYWKKCYENDEIIYI